MTTRTKQIIGAALLSTFLVSFYACKGKDKPKEEESKEKPFPAIPFIKSQIADVDTALYSIRKVENIDSVRGDTTYIRREDFKAAAHDFLALPDISSPPLSGKYKEEKSFPEGMNRVYLLSTPIDPESNEEIQRQEVLIKPDPSGDKVTSIFFTTSISNRDSLVEKRLLWQVDKSFQVTTIRQLQGQPETTTTYKVIWNEDE
jgi:hypothetical protein